MFYLLSLSDEILFLISKPQEILLVHLYVEEGGNMFKCFYQCFFQMILQSNIKIKIRTLETITTKPNLNYKSRDKISDHKNPLLVKLY